MTKLEGTIVLKFGGSGEGDYLFFIKLDEILNVDEEGKPITSIYPGRDWYFIVNHSDNIRIDEVVTTFGSIKQSGESSRSNTETNLFASRESEDPDKFEFDVIPSGFNVSYLGRSGGVSMVSDQIGRKSLIGDTSSSPFMAKIEYDFAVKLFKLSIPEMDLEDDESYPIGIVFYVSMV